MIKKIMKKVKKKKVNNLKIKNKRKGNTNINTSINTRRARMINLSNSRQTSMKTQDQRKTNIYNIYLNNNKVNPKKRANKSEKFLHKLTKIHSNNLIFSQGPAEDVISYYKVSNRSMKRLFTSKRKKSRSLLSNHNLSLSLNRSQKKGIRVHHIVKTVSKRPREKFSNTSKIRIKNAHHATLQHNLELRIVFNATDSITLLASISTKNQRRNGSAHLAAVLFAKQEVENDMFTCFKLTTPYSA